MNSQSLSNPQESLSLHPHVQAVVHGDTFIKAVRSYCITLKLAGINNPLGDEDIRQAALTHAYPRIALILACAKDSAGNPILGGMGEEQDYSRQYQEVVRLVTSPPYRDDIHRIAAQMTAAHLIKNLPLNTTLQFYTLGVNLDEQATQDLERISGALRPTPTPEQLTGPLAFYFMTAGGVLPEGVSCWYYITTTGGNGVLSSKQGTIPLPAGDFSNAIHYLSRELNELVIDVGGNLVTYPNRIQTASFDAAGVNYIYSIALSSRAISNRISHEVVTLKLIDGDGTQTVPGILYGVKPDKLYEGGPCSILVRVVNDKVVGTVDDKPSVLKAGSNQLRDIDTLYFRSTGLIEGDLVYRITASNSFPIERILRATTLGDLVIAFLEDLQTYRSEGMVLGSLPFPEALRLVVVNPLEVDQLQVILDILSLPQGVELATGDSFYRITPYEAGPRSIVLKASSGGDLSVADKLQANTALEPTTSTQVIHRKLSPRIQAVYDVMRRLQC